MIRMLLALLALLTGAAAPCASAQACAEPREIGAAFTRQDPAHVEIRAISPIAPPHATRFAPPVATPAARRIAIIVPAVFLRSDRARE